MIIKLRPDEIPAYWPVIKFGAAKVNSLSEKQMELYLRNLLKNLMADKFQCWFALTPEKGIKALAITRILPDIGDVPHLLIDAVYGYIPTTEEEKKEFFDNIVLFAENLRCASIVMWTANNVAMNAAEKAGFGQTHKVYTYMLGR